MATSSLFIGRSARTARSRERPLVRHIQPSVGAGVARGQHGGATQWHITCGVFLFEGALLGSVGARQFSRCRVGIVPQKRLLP